MNEWISRVFGQLLTILHVIVVLGLLVFWLGALDTSYNNLILTLMTLGIFLMYVIIIGIITTIISINDTLHRIEHNLNKKAVEAKKIKPDGVKTSNKTQSSIDAFNKGEI